MFYLEKKAKEALKSTKERLSNSSFRYENVDEAIKHSQEIYNKLVENGDFRVYIKYKDVSKSVVFWKNNGSIVGYFNGIETPREIKSLSDLERIIRDSVVKVNYESLG